MQRKIGSYMCYVCGWAGLKEDPAAQNHEICPCCSVHFGYNDWGPEEHERHAYLRQIWMENEKCAWWLKQHGPPEGWDAQKQLDKADFPDLRLKALKRLPDDWNSYGSPAPDHKVIDESHRILFALMKAKLTPNNILADADGGVAFVFVGNDKYRAVVSATNNFTVDTHLYDTIGYSYTREWPANYMAMIDNLTEQIRIHLFGQTS